MKFSEELLERKIDESDESKVVLWYRSLHFSYNPFYDVYMAPRLLKEFVDVVKATLGVHSFQSYTTKECDHGIFLLKWSNEERFKKLLMEFTSKHSLKLNPLVNFPAGGINL